jgi:hypothetical protein
MDACLYWWKTMPQKVSSYISCTTFSQWLVSTQQINLLILKCRFMDNEIPHLNPADGYNNNRYYNIPNKKYSLKEAEWETFECSDLICSKSFL